MFLWKHKELWVFCVCFLENKILSLQILALRRTQSVENRYWGLQQHLAWHCHILLWMHHAVPFILDCSLGTLHRLNTTQGTVLAPVIPTSLTRMKYGSLLCELLRFVSVRGCTKVKSCKTAVMVWEALAGNYMSCTQDVHLLNIVLSFLRWDQVYKCEDECDAMNVGFTGFFSLQAS